MYKRRSRLSAHQQGELIKLFVAEATARTAAEIVGVNRNTAAQYYTFLRHLIADKIPSYLLFDESHSRKRYPQGETGGESTNSMPVRKILCGLIRHDNKVCTAVYPEIGKVYNLPTNGKKIWPESIVHTDETTAKETISLSALHCTRYRPSDLISGQGFQIDEIENFWNQAKRQLRKYNGIKTANFYWYIKECEWRFSGGNHRQLLKQLRYWYKNTKH